jgi:hypothetical protein
VRRWGTCHCEERSDESQYGVAFKGDMCGEEAGLAGGYLDETFAGAVRFVVTLVPAFGEMGSDFRDDPKHCEQPVASVGP